METVYVNFCNDRPHSPLMTGAYVKEMSLPFLLVDNIEGTSMSICKALDDYRIPWIGKFNDSHAETITKDSEIIFSREIITPKPMFSETE